MACLAGRIELGLAQVDQDGNTPYPGGVFIDGGLNVEGGIIEQEGVLVRPDALTGQNTHAPLENASWRSHPIINTVYILSVFVGSTVSNGGK